MLGRPVEENACELRLAGGVCQVKQEVEWVREFQASEARVRE